MIEAAGRRPVRSRPARAQVFASLEGVLGLPILSGRPCGEYVESCGPAVALAQVTAHLPGGLENRLGPPGGR
jgi:hypothetical protein